MKATSLNPKSDRYASLTQDEIDRRRGRLVPWIITAFFLSFILVLSGMVYVAATHKQDEVTDQPYQKGLTYNQTLKASERAAALGWTISPNILNDRIEVQVTDHLGRGVRPDYVKVWFINSANAALDQHLNLVSSGDHFFAPIHLVRGQYQVHITAANAQDQVQTAILHEVE